MNIVLVSGYNLITPEVESLKHNTLFENIIKLFNSDYSSIPQLNWYSVAEWEQKVCSADLMKDLRNLPEYTTVDFGDSRVYGLSVTATPKIDCITINNTVEYLITVGWYLQSYISETKKYFCYIDNQKLIDNKEINLRDGDQGFYANYTTTRPNTFKIVVGSTEYKYKFINSSTCK